MDTEQARDLLLGRRAEVLRQLNRRARDLSGEDESQAAGELADYDQHQADSATELADREARAGRVQDLQARFDAIERALARCDDGTYGRDLVTGEPIPDERLRAVPEAETVADEQRGAAADAGDDDQTTPLDDDAPPPVDLATIPMDEGATHDPQAPVEAEAEAFDGPGMIYPEGGGPPEVGEPDPADEAVRRMYRPDE